MKNDGYSSGCSETPRVQENRIVRLEREGELLRQEADSAGSAFPTGPRVYRKHTLVAVYAEGSLK